MTPSTILSARSTSPPKSAWPGVSTMLIFPTPKLMAVFLARIVMPRSRSSSFESITRSATCSLARKVPAWRSMPSTSVVLPWSTWAMMAILRIVWLTGAVFPFLGFGRAGPRNGEGSNGELVRRTARQISFYQPQAPGRFKQPAEGTRI